MNIDHTNVLMSCPVCGGKVSSDAIACPHCGHPMQGSKHPIREVIEPIKATMNNVADSTKRIVEDHIGKKDDQFHVYVVNAWKQIGVWWITGVLAITLFAALQLVQMGSFAMLILIVRTCQLFPTKERYDKLKLQLERLEHFNENYHLGQDTVECPICGEKVSVRLSKCPTCKYKIGKKIEEARTAAEARGEVEPPEPAEEEEPKVEMPKPPISVAVVFVLIGVAFLGLIIFGIVRQVTR